MDRGAVRLSFHLTDFEVLSLEVKLPTEALKVKLAPLYARRFPPAIAPDQIAVVRTYRKDELDTVIDFLSSDRKRLLMVEGMPGVGKRDIVLAALHDRPDDLRGPVLWWDCQADDSLAMLAAELSRGLGDRILGSIERQRQEAETIEERRALDREATDRALTQLARSKPSWTVVLYHVEQWLGSEDHEIEDPALADFVASLVRSEYCGKLVLITESRPGLPRDVSPGWIEPLRLRGLSPDAAVGFMQDWLGLELDVSLLREVAERYAGHPLALQLIASGLDPLDRRQQAGYLRQLLEVGPESVDTAVLRSLFEVVHSRLSPEEARVLDLLGVVQRPLAVEEILDIGLGYERTWLLEELVKVVETLASRRYLLYRSEESLAVRYEAPEIVRLFILDRLLGDKAARADLHRRALCWYRKAVSFERIEQLATPDKAALADANELVRHAFVVAEMEAGEESEEVAFLAVESALALRNWHTVLDANRRMQRHFLRGKTCSRANRPSGHEASRHTAHLR